VERSECVRREGIGATRRNLGEDDVSSRVTGRTRRDAADEAEGSERAGARHLREERACNTDNDDSKHGGSVPPAHGESVVKGTLKDRERGDRRDVV